jgi:hypothetical protein
VCSSDLGNPGKPSDIFSFGLMLWEMVARSRIYKAFPGVADIPNADGSAKVELVASRLAGAHEDPPKPQRPEAPEGCPVLLYKLMQACWAHKMEDRPTASELLLAIKVIRTKEGAMDPPPPEPEPEPEPTFGEFLLQLGLQGKREALAEYLEDGNELRDLKQMDVDDLDDDILNDDDLGLDKDQKAAFRAAVAALRDMAAEKMREMAAAAAAENAGASTVDGRDTAWAELQKLIGNAGQVASSEERLRMAEKDLERAQADLQSTKMQGEAVKAELQQTQHTLSLAMSANVARMAKTGRAEAGA